VRGVTGLRVAGAAIMPTIVSGNTNAASMMIGDRCAQLLLGKG
jgi:choline dehydrogenase